MAAEHDPDNVRMTFAQHLDELRSRLLRGLLGFLVVAAAALFFQEELFRFFIQPYNDARVSIKGRTTPDVESGEPRRWSTEEIAEGFGLLEQQLEELPSPDAAASTAERLAQLESFVANFRDVFVRTAEGAARGGGVDIGPLRQTTTTEQFFAYLKAALLTAALISAPILLYQLWQFIGAGLYTHERYAVMRTLPLSVLLFGVGMSFGFLILVPVALDFLLSYGDPELVRAEITVGSYLSLLFILLFVMGMVFQVPLVMTVVSRMGLIEPATFRKHRRYFILGAFILAALLTPPDYVTQLLVAGPMMILFELGILLAMVAARRRKKDLAARAAEENS
jgi:sec-independent protein translocase protein TatC